MTQDVVRMMKKTVHFTGRVQGVGFRATTASIARGFDVAGTVENLDDGRVRLVVEGEADQVKLFMQTLMAELGRYIRQTDDEDGEATGQYGDPRALDAFKVRY